MAQASIGEEEEKFAENLSYEKVQEEEEEEVKRVTRKMKRQYSKPGMLRKGDSAELKFALQYKELKNVTEIELLYDLEKELEERKLSLERKLLELYGLKEQQSYIAQLRRDLQDKVTEIDRINGTVNSLGDEIKNLEKERKQAIMPKSQLKIAKKMIEKLQLKMDVDAGHTKRRLMMLEEQVSEFQCTNGTSINDAMVEKKLKATRQVELEYVEMQRRNKELEFEKRELTVKLLGAQTGITTLSNMTQDKIMAKLEEQMSILQHTNEDLSRQVERMQKNRFNMVEELVYQRWLNACLRFETQFYQTPSRKTSRDLSNNASHKSDKKAEQLSLDLSFDSLSSFTSSTESSEVDSSTTESSSNSQRSITKKSGLMHSIKSWGRSKDDLSAASSPAHKSCRRSLFTRNGLVRRHSTSMVPSNRPSLLSSTGDSTAIITPSGKKIVPESTESSNTPRFARGRRVSFCDSIETCVQEEPKSVGEVTDDMDMCTRKSGESLSMDTSPKCVAKFAEERDELSSLLKVPLKNPSDSSMKAVKKDSIDTQVGKRVKAELHSSIYINKGGTNIVLFVAVLLFFLLMLLL